MIPESVKRINFTKEDCENLNHLLADIRESQRKMGLLICKATGKNVRVIDRHHSVANDAKSDRCQQYFFDDEGNWVGWCSEELQACYVF